MTDLIDAAAMSQGAFRVGAQAMRGAIEMRGRDLLEKRKAEGKKGGNDYIAAAFAMAAEVPIPMFPPIPPRPDAAWQWWSGPNDEYFLFGPFENREDAIADARADYPDDPIYVAEAIRPRFRFTASRLIEVQFEEGAEDLYDYEHVEPERIGGADIIATADAELQALLDSWLSRWSHTFNEPNIFMGTRNEECVEPESSEEAA